MAGNSSASMPLMWVSNRPLCRCRTSPAWSVRSTLLAARQRVDEVGQELGRDRRRAIGLDLAGHPVGDPDLEIGRGQLETGVLGLEQDVGEDRQRAPVGHGPADDRQAARQVLLHDRKFHVGFTPPSSYLDRGDGYRGAERSPGRALRGRGYLLSIISPRHHRSNGVETVDRHAPRRTDGPLTTRRSRWTRTEAFR